MVANALINDFLNEHLQLVKSKGKFLDSTKVKRSVPQSTVLGPLLLNLSIKDILK